MRAPLVGIAVLLLGAGCPSATPSSTGDPVQADPQPAQEPEPEPVAEQPPPLSAEDLELIAADPATLTPDQRRQRAHALRRKILQNPDSPAARTLEDLRRAHEEGLLELPAKGDGVVLSLPGTKPGPNAPGPAGARPSDTSDEPKP